MESKPELEIPQVCFIPVHPRQGKKPADKGVTRETGLLCDEPGGSRLQKSVHRGEGRKGREPEKEESQLKGPKVAKDIES